MNRTSGWNSAAFTSQTFIYAQCSIRENLLPYTIDVCTICAYNKLVGFEWNEESKAGLNFQNHGVRMPETIPVFDDPYAITITDDESDPGEQRFVTLGMGTKARILVVVYTYRGENIRIISARPAEPREREEYEAGL
jgi:uncharacterized protein